MRAQTPGVVWHVEVLAGLGERAVWVHGNCERELAMAGTRFPVSAFVVVPACGDADLVLSDLIHQAVLVGDAP